MTDDGSPFWTTRRTSVSERALPDVSSIDHAEPFAPDKICSCPQSDEEFRDLVGAVRHKAEKDDSSGSATTQSNRQLTEVAIEGDQESMFDIGACQEHIVRCSRGTFSGRIHVVPCGAQGTNGRDRHILIQQ